MIEYLIEAGLAPDLGHFADLNFDKMSSSSAVELHWVSHADAPLEKRNVLLCSKIHLKYSHCHFPFYFCITRTVFHASQNFHMQLQLNRSDAKTNF